MEHEPTRFSVRALLSRLAAAAKRPLPSAALPAPTQSQDERLALLRKTLFHESLERHRPHIEVPDHLREQISQGARETYERLRREGKI